MNTKITDEEYAEANRTLLHIETELERIGRMICSKEGSGYSWNAINRAVEANADAIHNLYKMF